MTPWDDPDALTNDPWCTIDRAVGIVRNILATLGFFSTLVALGYFLELWT